MRKSQAVWYLRQIVPTRYRSRYLEDGRRWCTTWWMWFGRCFWIKRWAC